MSNDDQLCCDQQQGGTQKLLCQNGNGTWLPYCHISFCSYFEPDRVINPIPKFDQGINQTLLLPVSKRVEAHPDGVAKFANADCLKHSCVTQLRQDDLLIKVHWGFVHVRLDATNKPRRASVQHNMLCSSCCVHRVVFIVMVLALVKLSMLAFILYIAIWIT